MEAADSLIKSLASEKIRWSQQSSEITETLLQAIGNAAVASAFISYVIFGIAKAERWLNVHIHVTHAKK
jgi:hypothetical protein